MGTISQVVLSENEQHDRPANPADRDGARFIPARAGRYRLLGEIARGGMGAVHRGRDVELGRDLALKVLLEKHRNRRDLVERFIEEAQICGQLQHPGIVPVYELGVLADHRPFFSMKLVKGRTLAELLAEAGPGTDLPRFLSIFEAICQTVAYAHARGVIHRDLKPANVMVGSFGEVQVMDWGLAKVLVRAGETPVPERPATETVVATLRSTGDSELSQAGSVLGTPAYMAPEQARGEMEAVDRRSDVFALGSILCEILTGKPSFVGESMREILDLASRADTADAWARLESCGADADLVTLARDCLAAAPKKRPADAGIVAERLTAYLANVQTKLRQAELSRAAETARAEEAEAKATAERRARRLVAALAVTVFFAAGLGGAGWRWVELQRLDRIRKASERVNHALREATRLRTLAQAAAVDDVGPWDTAIVAVEKARDLLEPAIDPSLRKQVEELAAEAAVERDRARAAALAASRDRTLLDTLVDIRSAELDDPDGSITDIAYADAFRQAGLDVSALSSEEAARRLRSRPSGVASNLAVALDHWAAIRRDRRRDRAGAALLSALAAAADPDPWRIGLRKAFDSTDPEVRQESFRHLARTANFDSLGPISLDLLGRALDWIGDPAMAEVIYRKAQDHHPGDVWINYDLSRMLRNLGRRDEAIRFAMVARSHRPETAHELAHMLGQKGEQDAEIAVLADLARRRSRDGRHLRCLGQALQRKGRRKDAVPVLEAAEAVYREGVRLKPDDAASHYLLGIVLYDLGRYHQAIDEQRAAVRIRPDSVIYHTELGRALGMAGRPEQAITEARTAIRLNPRYATAHSVLGS